MLNCILGGKTFPQYATLSINNGQFESVSVFEGGEEGAPPSFPPFCGGVRLLSYKITRRDGEQEQRAKFTGGGGGGVDGNSDKQMGQQSGGNCKENHIKN